LPGELGKLALCNAWELARQGWHSFFLQQSTSTSIHPHLHNLAHPTWQYLNHLACPGVPSVITTPPWSLQEKYKAINHGPHILATCEFTNFLLADMYDYVNMGYWTVLPYSTLWHHPVLRLAPAGVVPQKEQRPHPIMDYSFYGKNSNGLPIAPMHSMQFGYCDCHYGPPLLAKLDLADGYYRVPLSATAALHLAVLLPPDGHCNQLIALPLSLPMGWSHSPPYFCAFTETVADVANASTDNALQLPKHPLLAATQLQPTTTPHEAPMPSLHFHPSVITLPTVINTPLQYPDVYIDDFILLAQQTCALHYEQHLTCLT